jgi:hypothetical protein
MCAPAGGRTAGRAAAVRTWWVANDVRVGADEVHAMFCRLTIPGLRRFFAAAPPGWGSEIREREI